MVDCQFFFDVYYKMKDLVVSKDKMDGVSEEGKQVYLMIGALLADAKEVLDKRDVTIKNLENEIVELKSRLVSTVEPPLK